jgi:excisionase family DNA binding protein
MAKEVSVSNRRIIGQPRNAWSIAEVAERNGVSRQFVRLEIARGRLKAKKIARRVLIPVSAENAWLDSASEVVGTSVSRKAEAV